MQLDVVREFVGRRELEVVSEFVDRGTSESRERRPALDELLDAVRKCAFDVVLVYRFDRFARSVRHLVTTLDELETLGVDFVSSSESLDTSTPLGRAIFSICAALAELERSVVVERSVEGQRPLGLAGSTSADLAVRSTRVASLVYVARVRACGPAPARPASPVRS